LSPEHYIWPYSPAPGVSRSCFSAMAHSVVSTNAAIDAAFCSAERVT